MSIPYAKETSHPKETSTLKVNRSAHTSDHGLWTSSRLPSQFSLRVLIHIWAPPPFQCGNKYGLTIPTFNTWSLDKSPWKPSINLPELPIIITNPPLWCHISVYYTGFPRLLENLEKPGIYFGSLNPGYSLEFCVKTLNPLEICERHKK